MMTQPSSATDWGDERLQAAFAARAAPVTVPADLVPATLGQLGAAAPRRTWAGRLLPLVAALVLALGAVGGGFALLSGPGGPLSGGVTFRDGPTPDLRTLDAGSFAFDFPAEWHAEATSGSVGSGGSIIAVLTTQAIDERCRGIGGLDVNCVYEQRLEPGTIRIVVGTGGYRGSTIFDRAAIDNGSTTRLKVGGMPTILDEFEVTPDDYYLADQSATWQIALPTSLSNVVRLEFMARDPDAVVARASVDEIAASFRFTPPPTPLPADLGQGVALGRTMLDAQVASFRQGYVRPDDVDSVTYLDCLPPTTGEDRVVLVQYGPGGDLGWNVLVRCRWMASAGDDGPFWRIDAVYEWTAGEMFGRYRESYWMDAAGAVVAMSNSGEVPPAGDPSATPTSTPVGPDGTVVITLGAPGDIATRDVRIVDRTGAFVSARPATSSERAFSTGDIPDGTVRLIDLPDGGILVRWDGGLCDDAFVLEVDAIDGGRTPDRVTLHGDRGGTCRLMRVAWGLRLDFGVAVDVASMVGRNFVGAAPAPSIPPSRPLPWPRQVLGLEVIDVDAALKIQALPGDDREIAVRGWIWRLNPATLDCLVFERTDVEELFFGEGCRSDSLTAAVDGTFDDATLPLAIGQASTGSLPFDRRVEVVLIGHFDDRRSGGCSSALTKRCADMFWVDGVSLDGQLAPRDWVDFARGAPRRAPIHTHDQAWDRVRGPEEDPSIALSVGQVTGLTLARMEPATVGRIPAEVWYWHVTAYEPSSGRLRTFVLPDSVLGDYDGIVSYEVVGDEVLVTTAIID